MDVETILKINLQQKWSVIFYQIFQYLKYHILKAWIISMMYTEVKIA